MLELDLLYAIVEFMSSAFSIGGQVFFALAAWQDARARNNRYATMWALLIGFLGWIPGIIYLCLRTKQTGSLLPPISCPRCRAGTFPGQVYCVYCGTPIPAVYPEIIPNFCMPEESARRMAKAKYFLIAGIVLLVVSRAFVIIDVIFSFAEYGMGVDPFLFYN